MSRLGHIQRKLQSLAAQQCCPLLQPAGSQPEHNKIWVLYGIWKFQSRLNVRAMQCSCTISVPGQSVIRVEQYIWLGHLENYTFLLYKIIFFVSVHPINMMFDYEFFCFVPNPCYKHSCARQDITVVEPFVSNLASKCRWKLFFFEFLAAILYWRTDTSRSISCQNGRGFPQMYVKLHVGCLQILKDKQHTYNATY